MSSTITLIGGAALGIAAGSLLVPLTRRELAGAMARASTGSTTSEDAVGTNATHPAQVPAWHWVALGVISGVLPAYVLHRVGWSINAIPPLLLLIGLVQLAYCDLMRRLLPKTLVYALSAAVIVSGVVIAGVIDEWHRLLIASGAGLAFFALFFVMNLVNPRWIAFGDVRLSLAVGLGLGWLNWVALVEGLFFSNLLAVVIGLGLIASHKTDRRSAMPFGLYLALGTALVLATWS
jgi:prepilin signal peptidase PulO-like enzyme (type II secretory pathway)